MLMASCYRRYQGAVFVTTL